MQPDIAKSRSRLTRRPQTIENMVSWSVRPNVVKVHIGSVQEWFEDNPFDEEYAHAVRNLVTNENLLSEIG